MPNNDSMLEVYLFENLQLLEKLESLLLACDKAESFTAEDIGEIFRILHTIKGSSAMMNFDNIAALSHAMEDMFGYLREHEIAKGSYNDISKLAFETLDTVKEEISKVQSGNLPDGDLTELISRIKSTLSGLEQGKSAEAAPAEVQQPQSVKVKTKTKKGAHCYKAEVFFDKEARMENIRAFGIVRSIENMCSNIVTVPNDLLGDQSSEIIINDGFKLYMTSEESKDVLSAKIHEAFFIKEMKFEEMDEKEASSYFECPETKSSTPEAASKTLDTVSAVKQNYMSVNLSKLDQLMDLVGEIVITESTVTKNPEISKLKLESFEKASRQLRKLTDELQDIVMSIRMVPVAATFHKMERIVHDMSAKIGKKAQLVIVGGDTELDKNVLDNLSDPLMHMVRNAMDHGLETAEERKKAGKDPVGKIVLEARNTGSDVMIYISDDGHGLNKDELIKKATKKGLIKKPASEISDKEAYNLIFAPGFSTKEEITEYSGRGVGMDVVVKNIEKIGGSLAVNSKPGEGMDMQIRIPLTLAIIDGMHVRVGSSSYIIPLLNIRESFKPAKGDVFSDPSGNEMIYIRGKCHSVVRLSQLFNIDGAVTKPEDGILVTLETQSQTYCLLVDELVEEQQTVVKPMPTYIMKLHSGMGSISGCTILGDGSISLIIDVNGLINDVSDKKAS